MCLRRQSTAGTYAACIAIFICLLGFNLVTGLDLAFIPEPLTSSSAAHKTGKHDISAYSRGLKQMGHTVTVIKNLPDEEDLMPLLSGTKDAPLRYDAIISQGRCAKAVADFAAKLEIPVVRFVADRSKNPEDFPHPFFERPAVLVFANEYDMEVFGNDQMEHALRLVLSPSSTRVSLTSQMSYKKLEEAIEIAVDMDPNEPPIEQRSLGLVMIVKNEVATINKTLASMRNDLDYWTIIDTGSTDGTQDEIRTYMEGYPGDLYEEPFVDFSTTRNFALRAHGQKTAYAFMVDADYAVNNTWRLRVASQRMQRECLYRSLPVCAKAAQIRLYTGSTIFYTTRVFPTEEVGTDLGWRYFYPVHESPSNPAISYMNEKGIDDVIRFPMIKMYNLPITHNKSSERWKNLDLPLLTKEHEKSPHDTRIVFYLAQTLDLVEDLPAALAMYQKRIDMGGWQQEIFEAHMRRGRIKHDRMPLGSEDPRPDFLKAHRMYPNRAEPLIWMCWHHHKLMNACPGGHSQEACWLRERTAAYLYAKRAAALPMPDEGLFMNKPVYDYQALDALVLHAYYVSKHLSAARRIGHAAALYVQSKFPGPEHRARNAMLYAELEQQAIADGSFF